MIADLRLQRRRRAIDDVRRVRDDRVERAVHAVQQVRLVEDDALPDAVAPGVPLRDIERFGRDVGRGD